jgi:glycosyltransferase involved in cell wall biosynthesis
MPNVSSSIERIAPAQTISVALCTYNGERFLGGQLASIARQTRPPDQLVICDDGSTDSTMAIAEAFALTAPFRVAIYRNPVNLGSTKNFEQAIMACTGDLIALSDQDDLWHPDRLRRSEEELNWHPEAGLVFTDGEVIDDNGEKIGVRLWENFELVGMRKEELRGGNFIPMTRKRFVTGATVMFRASYRQYCFPVGDRWVHDGWMAAMIGSMASIRLIDEQLISYRQHSSQQIGLGPGRAQPADKMTIDLMAKQHWSTFIRFVDDLAQVCDAVDQLPIDPQLKEHGAYRDFKRQHDFLAMRLALPESRLARLPIMLGHIPDYFVCAMGFLSVAKDLLLPKPPGIERWTPDV